MQSTVFFAVFLLTCYLCSGCSDSDRSLAVINLNIEDDVIHKPKHM